MPEHTINWHDETTRRFITSRVPRLSEQGNRQCFYVDDLGRAPKGIVPVLVSENEPGYSPMIGDTPAGTWYWGATLEEAQEIADLANLEVFNLDREQATAIVGSSITAQVRADAERERYDRVMTGRD